MFKINNGSSALPTILLMLIIISIAAIGFVFLISASSNQVNTVNNNTGNLSGITYTSEIYNGTNSTLHGLSNIMPNFIWIIIIFIIIGIMISASVILGKK